MSRHRNSCKSNNMLIGVVNGDLEKVEQVNFEIVIIILHIIILLLIYLVSDDLYGIRIK